MNKRTTPHSKKAPATKNVAKKNVAPVVVAPPAKRRGRPPGTGGKKSIVPITLKQLMALFGEDAVIQVSRTWLESHCTIEENTPKPMIKLANVEKLSEDKPLDIQTVEL